MQKSFLAGTVAAGLLLLSAAAALAAPPADVADLVGIKGRDGESELEARGYAFHRGAEAKDGKITFWKNSAAKSCIEVLTQDGRYKTIEPAPPEACQDSQ